MSSKHTPGPWSYSKGERHNFFYIDSPSGDVVYVTESLQPDHVEANARLIAAAPELLYVAELVDDVSDRIDHDPDSAFGQLVAAARAAIAKATGGEQ